ncbi:MAG: hypothetical protein PF689_02345 [Deltaproteobacteria bacterium]|jgi:hypothetical protein|nr:hypothetical protein [Deltaproteobacteria bacterium]
MLKQKFLFISYFLSFCIMQSPVPIAQAKANSKKNLSEVEKKFLKKLYPQLVKGWDNGVITLAKLLLKSNHSFNNKGLLVSLEIMFSAGGKTNSVNLIAYSCYNQFDDTAIDAVSSLQLNQAPPAALLSDDGAVHVFVTLKRIKPYSSLNRMQVRYVRYSNKQAVQKYIEKGLINQAWKRLIKEKKKNDGKLSAECANAFVTSFLQKYMSSDKINQKLINNIYNLVNWKQFPFEIALPYLQEIQDRPNFETLIGKILKKNKSKFCRIMKQQLDKDSELAAKFIDYALQNKQNNCFDEEFFKKANRIKDPSFQILLAGARDLKNTQSDSTIESFLVKKAKENTTALTAIKTMGYLGKAVFFEPLKKIIENSSESSIKAAAVIAISRLSLKKAGLYLLSVLKSNEDKVKYSAIKGTTIFQGPEKDKLAKFFIWSLDSILKKSKKSKLKREAAKALIKLTQTDLENVNNKHYFYTVFRKADQTILPHLIAAARLDSKISKKVIKSFLKNKSADIRLVTINKLGFEPDDFKPYLFKKDYKDNSPLRPLSLVFEKRKKNLFYLIRSKGLYMSAFAGYALGKQYPEELYNSLSEMIKKKTWKNEPQKMLPWLLGLYGNTLSQSK